MMISSITSTEFTRPLTCAIGDDVFARIGNKIYINDELIGEFSNKLIADNSDKVWAFYMASEPKNAPDTECDDPSVYMSMTKNRYLCAIISESDVARLMPIVADLKDKVNVHLEYVDKRMTTGGFMYVMDDFLPQFEHIHSRKVHGMMQKAMYNIDEQCGIILNGELGVIVTADLATLVGVITFGSTWEFDKEGVAYTFDDGTFPDVILDRKISERVANALKVRRID